MKFIVPWYSCPQNPWLVGCRSQIPVLSVLCPQLNLLNPSPEQNSWIRHCLQLLICSTYVAAGRQQHRWNISEAVRQPSAPDDGRKRRPKHLELSWVQINKPKSFIFLVINYELNEDVGTHVYIVDNSSKYFGAQQYKGNTLLGFYDNTVSIFVFSTVTCGSTIHRGRILSLAGQKLFHERATFLRYEYAAH